MAGGNQYNEHWTIEQATEFINEGIELSNNRDYDFIGEVAKEQGAYKEVYNYIVAKYPLLNKLLKQLKSNCESNCFYNGKKGNIIASLAIMNLKSNHGWTDRVDNTSKGKEIMSDISDKELEAKVNKIIGK